MVDWKSYKNKGPKPWNFSPSLADEYYNEGDRITTLGSPVWAMDKLNTPITPTHHPCGVWNKHLVDTEPLTPHITYGSAPNILHIAWTPHYGGSLGRFVAVRGDRIRMYYSDTGGVTWPAVPMGWLPASTIITDMTIDFDRVYGGGVFTMNLYCYGDLKAFTAVSADGLNWTLGSKNQGKSSSYERVWVPAANLWWTGTYLGGGTGAFYTSPDCLNWTYYGTSPGYITGSAPIVLNNGVILTTSPNMQKTWVSYDNLGSLVYTYNDPTSPYWPYKWNTVITREQIKMDSNNVVWYSGCYLPGGSTFHQFPYSWRFERMDFSPEANVLAAYDMNTVPMDLYIYKPDQGIWYYCGPYEATVYRTGPTDVAVGNDRAIYINDDTMTIVTGIV